MAAQYLKAVVDSGEYQLMDDYAELFAFGTKNCAESVFEIQHSNLFPSDWSWYEGNGIVQLCGIRGLCSDDQLYAPGWGFMPLTKDLNDHFLADDQYRRDAAIIDEAELASQLSSPTSCKSALDLSQVNAYDYEGFWQQKYANFRAYNGDNVNGGDPNLTKDPNTYSIRYADVLLMLAEALTRGTGSQSEAMTYIDMVRERAAGPGDNSGNFTTAQNLMTQQNWSLLDVIWYERRAELAGEGDRWFDLVRSGRATADLFGAEKGANFSQEKIYLPISYDETTVAKNITTYPDAGLFE